MNEGVRVLLCSSPAAAVPAALALHGEKAKTSFTKYKNLQKVIQTPLVLKVSLKKCQRKEKEKGEKAGQGALIAQRLSFFGKVSSAVGV